MWLHKNVSGYAMEDIFCFSGMFLKVSFGDPKPTRKKQNPHYQLYGTLTLHIYTDKATLWVIGSLGEWGYGNKNGRSNRLKSMVPLIVRNQWSL